MSEVEKTPDPVADEKPEDNEPTSANEAEKEPEETESKASKESGDKGTVLDMFKKFASSGPSWADLMVEEAIQHETAQQKLKMDRINEAIVDFKEPFIVYASNMSTEMTAEEVFFAFGGEDKVIDMFLYEGQTGEALVEFKDKNSLADALMLHEQIVRKKKLNVEYVDACSSRCFTIPQPSGAKIPQAALPTQDRAPMNRMGNGNRRNRQEREGPPSKGYENRPYGNRQPPRQQQSNDVRMTNRPSNQPQIPSLFNSNPRNYRDRPPLVEPSHQSDSRYSNRNYDSRPQERYSESRQSEAKHFTQPEPRHSESRQSESKPVEPKVPKASPFGSAKPVDTGVKLREFQEKIESESKKPTIQKKQSISSQHSQQLSEDQSVDEPKQPVPEPPKPLAEAPVVEPEKKPHNITNVVSSKRRNLQHQRSDHSGGGHGRGGQKINVQQVQKFLGMSQKSLVDAGKEDRKKGGDVSSEVGSAVSTHNERRYSKRRNDHRKDSSATTHSTGAHKELHKQSSNEAKSPPRPAPITVPSVPENPPEVNTPIFDSAVSTPTANEPTTPAGGNSESTAPATTKSKKPKSKKKKSNAGTPNNNSMFAVLGELRE